MPARSKFDEETKRAIVQKLLRGEVTVSEIVKQNHLNNPYQVHAWVGQMILGEGIGRKYRISPDGTQVQDGSRPKNDGPLAVMLYQQITGKDDEPEDPIRAIGEWYVKTVFLKEKGGEHPPHRKNRSS